MMFSRRSSPIFSMSSQRTPEWPRMSEFMRMRIAPRTQASGMLVDASGSCNGRADKGVVVCEGRTPVCWCCKRAWPSKRGSFVRVSALHTCMSETNSVRKCSRVLTTATETRAHSVDALFCFDLANDDLSTCENTVAHVWRVVERNSSPKASCCSNR